MGGQGGDEAAPRRARTVMARFRAALDLMNDNALVGVMVLATFIALLIGVFIFAWSAYQAPLRDAYVELCVSEGTSRARCTLNARVVFPGP